MLAGKTVTAIDAGDSFSLAVCSDGVATAWGYNNYDQLGNNRATSSSVPVAVATSSLAAGEKIVGQATGSLADHSLALVASPPMPVAVTLPATDLAATAATLNGTVNAGGANTTVAFEYGPTTGYGTTVAATPAAVTGTTPTPVTATLGGLSAGTYHFRIVATHPYGTVHGEDMIFTIDSPDGGGLGRASPQLALLPGGRIELKFQGLPGRTYQIQRSPDLTTWLHLATVTADPTGTLNFIDEAPPRPDAFYRLELP